MDAGGEAPGILIPPARRGHEAVGNPGDAEQQRLAAESEAEAAPVCQYQTAAHAAYDQLVNNPSNPCLQQRSAQLVHFGKTVEKSAKSGFIKHEPAEHTAYVNK